MKTHLPALLRRSVLNLVCVFGYTLFSGSSIAANELYTLGAENTLFVDYSDSATIVDLQGGILQLEGNTLLNLASTGEGDGRVYTLLTGVSGLVDAQGNAISLDVSNNAVSNYFAASLPGTGFWAGATLQLSDDGVLQMVRHNEIVKSPLEITIRNTAGGDYDYYESITIRDISSSSSSTISGGAILRDSIHLNNNGRVIIVRNTLSSSKNARGGAINASTVALIGNGQVYFENCSAISSRNVALEGAYGGAIYAGESVAINNNGVVVFANNSASSSSALGGAIYGASIMMQGNKQVEFSENGGVARGGGVFATKSFNLCDNENVSFSANYSRWQGGAVHSLDSIQIEDNENVLFQFNAVSCMVGRGGAIMAEGDLCIRNNGKMSFAHNAVQAEPTARVGSGCLTGGAINVNGKLTISDNDILDFEKNYVVVEAAQNSSSARGGAIETGGICSFSNNGCVNFRVNYASSETHEANGGAISGWEHVELNHNGEVAFIGNRVGSSTANALGGAIFAHDGLSICNNGNVLFEKNVEITAGEYRLRSIYALGGDIYEGDVYDDYKHLPDISFSAASGNSICFYDSVYVEGSYYEYLHEDGMYDSYMIGTPVHMNKDCLDAMGNAVKQKGDIVFSGKYTETHLNEILEADAAGRKATAAEILNSRTTVINGLTNLYGGRLRIEDGAIYKGEGITVAEGANATLMLKDGTLSHAGCDITISSGSVLSAEGTNSLTASVLTIQDGGMMQLALGMAQVDGAAVLTTTGSLNMGNISFDLTGTEYLTAGEYKLLTRTEGVDYDISGWTLNGATSDQLRWKNGTLYYTGGHDWNHGVTDDDDISDLGEILGNLIINGGDITLDDVVNAIQDAVDAGFGHGQGHIVINRGGIHISGAGDLDGHIIFNGDLKDIRKLFIEKDITNIKIELGGSSEAENIVDVGGEYTVEIDSLAGDGSMSKTGEGEMVVHGHGHKVGGMLDVQEGTLTFTAGNETAGEPTGTETEVNELVVGNKKDKEAKVKVEKDTKVKGNKMQVDGQHAVVTNNGTMDFSGEVKVKKGHLENNGSISKVTLEGGKVSGSGEFAGLEMLGGELVVGNSPGLQTYTDSATFTEGSIIFSMADTDTAATSGTSGWDSSAYSTIDMDGNALMLGENVNIVLELGGAALESLAAEVNATLEFSLKLIQNIDSASLTMGAEGFAMLLDNTRILITEDSEGLTAATLHLAGLDITDMLSNAAYRYEGSTLVFSGTVTNNGTLTVPEPSTATLSLLALAGLCARRRRK